MQAQIVSSGPSYEPREQVHKDAKHSGHAVRYLSLARRRESTVNDEVRPDVEDSNVKQSNRETSACNGIMS